MLPRFILDTNIISDLVRHPQGRIAKRIHRVGEQAVCTSIIVAAELRFGAAKSGSTRLARQVERILSALEVLPLGEPADRQYASLRRHLEKRGQPIGANDMLIAAQALADDCTLVSANEREFARVPSLKVENWLAA